MEQLIIDGKTFRADTIPLKTSAILVIQGEIGMLGCGYLSIETADKLGHALATVSGVACYDDMLKAKVGKVSAAAAKLGITPGMSGKEALARL